MNAKTKRLTVKKKKNAENRAIADLRLAAKMVFIYPSRVAARARSSRM
jgi:hypothetical protein